MLLEKYRLLLHAQKIAEDPADAMLVSTVSTMAELHVGAMEGVNGRRNWREWRNVESRRRIRR